MATRVFAGYRLFADDGSVCTDGQIAFYEAGTSTPLAVYSDRALSSSLGATVSLGSLGVASDIWVADTVSVKAVITGTGVTQDTIDYLTVATSTATGATGADVALGNGLVNGAFEGWAAGTSFTDISGDGDGDVVADGWYFTQPTAASNEVSRQTAQGAQARYGIRFGRAASSVSTNELRLWQMLPTAEAYRYRNQEITISARVTAGANFSASGLKVRLATGTAEAEDGDNIAASTLTGHTNAIDVTQTITTTVTRYEFSATLASGIKEVGIQFSYVPVGTAGANDWVQIEDVQIEIGAAATTFKFVSESLDFIRNSMTSAGRALLDDASASAQRTTLGVTATGADTTYAYRANDLSDLASASTARTNLGLGTAATQNTSTSGANVPLMNGANTWSALQTFSVAGAAGSFINTTDAAANQTLTIESDRATPANGDSVYIDFKLSDSAGNQDTFGRIRVYGPDVTTTAEDGNMRFFTSVAGTITEMLQLAETSATFAQPILAPAGSASAPSLSFSGDPNTGVYNSGADQLDFATGGAQRWSITSTGHLFPNGAVQVYGSTGGASAPAFTFSGDGNTGLYRIGADNAGFACNGAKVLDISTTGLGVTGTINGRVSAGTTTTGTLVAGDANDETHATGDITVPASVFSQYDKVKVYAGAASRTLTQGSSLTQRLHGSATTGNLTLAARGMALIEFISATECVVSGDVS